MLSSAEIAAMRSVQAQALPDLCTIQRKGGSADGKGGTTVSYSVQASNVACRLGRAGSRSGIETIDADKLQQQTPWIVTFAHDEDVQNTDRIFIDSRMFEVVSIEPHEAWTMALRAQVTEVAEGDYSLAIIS